MSKLLYLKKVDPAIKAHLAAEADERGVSVNDVAIAILAERFDVPFEPAGGNPRDRTDSDKLQLRMSPRLYKAIEKAKGSGSKKAVVESTLREHFAAVAA